MEYQTEFTRLISIQEELREVAASMPREEEVKQIIWEILSGTRQVNETPEPQPVHV